MLPPLPACVLCDTCTLWTLTPSDPVLSGDTEIDVDPVIVLFVDIPSIASRAVLGALTVKLVNDVAVPSATSETVAQYALFPSWCMTMKLLDASL